MKRIGKELLFKTVTICLSISFFTNTIGYAAPNLRVKAIDKKRAEQAIEKLSKLKIKDTIQSGRKPAGFLQSVNSLARLIRRYMVTYSLSAILLTLSAYRAYYYLVNIFTMNGNSYYERPLPFGLHKWPMLSQINERYLNIFLMPPTIMISFYSLYILAKIFNEKSDGATFVRGVPSNKAKRILEKSYVELAMGLFLYFSIIEVLVYHVGFIYVAVFLSSWVVAYFAIRLLPFPSEEIAVDKQPKDNSLGLISVTSSTGDLINDSRKSLGTIAPSI